MNRDLMAEYDAIMSRQSDILRRTAVALRGPEPELTQWSVHDLPERATALAAELEQWRGLSDVGTLHANLLRGQPARLPRHLLMHLLGDDSQAVEAERSRLRDAVKLAHERFSAYALTHLAKRTPEGDAKAAENLRLAEIMRKALEGGA
jgi:hypothetical protein